MTAERERASVVKMGGFTPEGDPIGWEFDTRGKPQLMSHTVVAGRLVEIGGWTVLELAAMWAEAAQLHKAARGG